MPPKRAQGSLLASMDPRVASSLVAKGARRVEQALAACVGAAVRVRGAELVRRLLLLYFLNDSQDLQTMLAADAQATCYAEYEVPENRLDAIFRTRRDLRSRDRARKTRTRTSPH